MSNSICHSIWTEPQNTATRLQFHFYRATLKSEYLTLRYIFPFWTESLAPETTQYPGVFSGPLIISLVSTYPRSLGLCTGGGKAKEYWVVSIVSSPGIGWPFCPSWKKNGDMLPYLKLNWSRLEDWSHSGGFFKVAPMTLENRSRKSRHLFSTCNWAPVTMERVSSDSTGEVQTYDKQFHLTLLWKLQL